MEVVDSPKFKLGNVVITSGAKKMLDDKMISPLSFLQRHQNCDWSDMCAEDRKLNEAAIRNKQRGIFSIYKIGTRQLYIITEFSRSVTTLLLSSEY